MFSIQVLLLVLVLVKNSEQHLNKYQLNFERINPITPPHSCFFETFNAVPTSGVTKSVEAYEDSGGTTEWLFSRSYTGPVMDIKTCHRYLGKKIFFEFGLTDYNITDVWTMRPGYTGHGIDPVTRHRDWELQSEYTEEGQDICLNVKVSCLKIIGELVEGQYMRVEVQERIGGATRCIYIKPIIKDTGFWNLNLKIGIPGFTLPDPLTDSYGCYSYQFFAFILASIFCMIFFCCLIPLYSHPDVIFEYKVDKQLYNPYLEDLPPPKVKAPKVVEPETVPDITLSEQVIYRRSESQSAETVQLIT